MSYKERLRCIDLHSLELRRLHLDLIFCYKIVFGLVDIAVSYTHLTLPTIYSV